MPSLITGSPIGNVTNQSEIYIEGSPYIYIQQTEANPLNNPDASSFYWGLSGTSTYPVFQLGCVMDVSLTEGVTMNAIRCDTDGDRGVIQRRDYLEFGVTIQSIFPLSVLRHMLNLGAVTDDKVFSLVSKSACNFSSLNIRINFLNQHSQFSFYIVSNFES